jgi:hypothetical protein
MFNFSKTKGVPYRPLVGIFFEIFEIICGKENTDLLLLLYSKRTKWILMVHDQKEKENFLKSNLFSQRGMHVSIGHRDTIYSLYVVSERETLKGNLLYNFNE